MPAHRQIARPPANLAGQGTIGAVTATTATAACRPPDNPRYEVQNRYICTFPPLRQTDSQARRVGTRILAFPPVRHAARLAVGFARRVMPRSALDGGRR